MVELLPWIAFPRVVRGGTLPTVSCGRVDNRSGRRKSWAAREQDYVQLKFVW